MLRAWVHPSNHGITVIRPWASLREPDECICGSSMDTKGFPIYSPWILASTAQTLGGMKQCIGSWAGPVEQCISFIRLKRVFPLYWLCSY